MWPSGKAGGVRCLPLALPIFEYQHDGGSPIIH